MNRETQLVVVRVAVIPVTAGRLPSSSPPPATCESVDLDAKWYLVGGVPVQGEQNDMDLKLVTVGPLVTTAKPYRTEVCVEI